MIAAEKQSEDADCCYWCCLPAQESFEHVEDWLVEVDRFANPRACRMLLGNKSDLPSQQVTREEAQALADKLGLPFLETSAKTAANVEAAFLMMNADLVRQRWVDGHCRRASLLVCLYG
jgi:Ras-related protein Rab-1A